MPFSHLSLLYLLKKLVFPFLFFSIFTHASALTLPSNRKSRVAFYGNPAVLSLKTRGFPSPPRDEFGFIIIFEILNSLSHRQPPDVFSFQKTGNVKIGTFRPPSSFSFVF
jgi:hypothetical protein